MDIRNRKFRVGFILSATVILLVFAVGIFAYITPDNSKIKENLADSGEQSAITSLASTTSSYGKFANKSKYSFTDKTKIASYRASADNTGTDTTTIEVDSSATHGSQENPYVIDNFAGWTHFVTEMQKNSSTTYTYGQGKYYVLAVDLDFDASGAPEEKPLHSFGGTLYGLGHTISNWKYTENSSSSEEGVALIRYGLMGVGTEITITDLNMDKYEINNASKANGAILGDAYSATSWFLNCHTIGTISREIERGTWIGAGGIICGTRDVIDYYNYAPTATIYRCSADIEFTVSDSQCPGNVDFGGICAYNDNNCSLNIYDCYVNSVTTIDVKNHSSVCIFFGGIVGESDVGKDRVGGVVTINNCVSKTVNNFPNSLNTTWYNGGVTGFNELSNATQTAVSEISNAYVSSTLKWYDSNNSKDRVNKGHAWSFKRSTSNNKKAMIKASGDIFYTGEASIDGLDNWTELGNTTSDSVTPTLLGTATTSGEAQLWTTAKNSSKLKSKIWKQKANIGSAYSIQNSPVINKFDTNTFKITYKDAHTDGTDTEIDTGTYNYGSTPGLKSQTNKTGKTFLGYTFDRTSMANPFKTLHVVSGSSYYGDLDLYAVWDVADADVTKDITVSGGKDESGTIVADYGEVIMLTADINCEAMGSDITLEYEWRQGANVIATGENLSLTNVSDSGTYTLYYKIKSSTDTL